MPKLPLTYRLNRVALRWAGMRFLTRVPHGVDDLYDIARTGLDVRTILDVGANVGQSAARFLHAFPSAHVHCFEPVAATFAELQRGLSEARATCHPFAVSDAAGELFIRPGGRSTTARVVEAEDAPRDADRVQVTTLDAFCSDARIEQIDLLKIDTEGHDLAVLQGARNLLENGRVSAVLTEISFRREARRLALFDEVRDLLATHGFDVLGVYDQSPDWSGAPRLLFANVLFVRQRESR